MQQLFYKALYKSIGYVYIYHLHYKNTYAIYNTSQATKRAVYKRREAMRIQITENEYGILPGHYTLKEYAILLQDNAANVDAVRYLALALIC